MLIKLKDVIKDADREQNKSMRILLTNYVNDYNIINKICENRVSICLTM